MNQEVKVLSIIGLITAVILIVGVYFLSKGQTSTSVLGDATDPSLLIRQDSFQTASSSAQTKVTLVEFGDFECPACGASYPVVKQLKSDYSNDLNIVFRNFPLTQHKNALIGAKAAEAAGVQGKFWEMHDKLFENQTDWSTSQNPKEKLIQYAKDLGLNIDQFQKSLDDPSIAQKIERDRNDGNTLGVASTPTFFINNQKISLRNFSDLKTYIEDELKK